jgi:hypothetical protein
MIIYLCDVRASAIYHETMSDCRFFYDTDNKYYIEYNFQNT